MIAIAQYVLTTQTGQIIRNGTILKLVQFGNTELLKMETLKAQKVINTSSDVMDHLYPFVLALLF